MKKYYRLLATGLLITSTPKVITRFFALPDFFTGVLMGIGLGMMILAFFKIRAQQQA